MAWSATEDDLDLLFTCRFTTRRCISQQNAVGPQALANPGSYGTGVQAGWNTGAAQQAAAIFK
ncbi:hypothetical protein OHA40_27915 [Nocardia sp. NBC_00508]|uniref:hypothetical protein n=1 Tax=Nocardia sp. NBC_00508 TaxID=2975992 RepID=UPI002E812BC3|nr:hypothetical protein [Nocardia sp. NBC_00508]WUD65416.1 hypothetical protein OHA40_27915 [Nocardia sp. NBC_00508]